MGRVGVVLSGSSPVGEMINARMSNASSDPTVNVHCKTIVSVLKTEHARRFPYIAFICQTYGTILQCSNVLFNYDEVAWATLSTETTTGRMPCIVTLRGKSIASDCWDYLHASDFPPPCVLHVSTSKQDQSFFPFIHFSTSTTPAPECGYVCIRDDN